MDVMSVKMRERLEDELISFSERFSKMRGFLEANKDRLRFDPDYMLLVTQANVMGAYISILRLRLQNDSLKREANESIQEETVGESRF